MRPNSAEQTYGESTSLQFALIVPIPPIFLNAAPPLPSLTHYANLPLPSFAQCAFGDLGNHDRPLQMAVGGESLRDFRSVPSWDLVVAERCAANDF